MSTLLPILFSLTSLSTHENYHGPSPWFFGILILFSCAFGDTLDYFVGRLSDQLLHHWQKFKRFINEEELQKGEAIFKEKGATAIVTMAPVPVLHSTVSLAAGAMHYPYVRFITYNTAANIVLVCSCIVLSRWFGNIPFIHHHLLLCTALMFILFIVVGMLLKKAVNPTTKS